MARMNEQTRRNVIETCSKCGFTVKLKPNGEDEYQKNLMFKSSKYASLIFICKHTGINPSGEINYLKIAVDPQHFKTAAINLAKGVVASINRKTKDNYYLSSNYRSFPVYTGNDEPSGRCYKVTDLNALEGLLTSLIS